MKKDLCEGVDLTKPQAYQNRWRWKGGPQPYLKTFKEFKELEANEPCYEHKMVRKNAGQWQIKYRPIDGEWQKRFVEVLL